VATAADSCPDLLATGTLRRATSFAVTVDVVEAASALEVAIQADTQLAMQAQLDVAAEWLDTAAAHYRQVGDGPLAQRAQCAGQAVRAWAALPEPLPGDLVDFQQTTLVPFHGVLRRLADDAAAQGARDQVEVFYASMLFLTSLMVGGWAAGRQGLPIERRRRRTG